MKVLLYHKHSPYVWYKDSGNCSSWTELFPISTVWGPVRKVIVTIWILETKGSSDVIWSAQLYPPTFSYADQAMGPLSG